MMMIMMIMMNQEIIELKRTQARTVSMVVIWQQKFAMSLKKESKWNEEKKKCLSSISICLYRMGNEESTHFIKLCFLFFFEKKKRSVVVRQHYDWVYNLVYIEKTCNLWVFNRYDTWPNILSITHTCHTRIHFGMNKNRLTCHEHWQTLHLDAVYNIYKLIEPKLMRRCWCQAESVL